MSEPAELSSGVAQGSVLGPLLFIVCINDFCEIFAPSFILKLFADDAKFYTEIKTSADRGKMQTCLDNYHNGHKHGN